MKIQSLLIVTAVLFGFQANASTLKVSGTKPLDWKLVKIESRYGDEFCGRRSYYDQGHVSSTGNRYSARIKYKPTKKILDFFICRIHIDLIELKFQDANKLFHSVYFVPNSEPDFVFPTEPQTIECSDKEFPGFSRCTLNDGSSRARFPLRESIIYTNWNIVDGNSI